MAAEVAPTRSRASRPIADELGQARPGAEVGCYDSGPVPLLIGVE